MSEIKPWREYIGKPEAYMIMCDVLNVLCEKEAIKKAVYERLKQAPSTYEWIPCSERLPNKDGRYLVCMDWAQDNVDVLRWADGWNCFRDFDGNVYRKSELDRDIVIAWMPLPEPYQKEGDQ